MSPIGLRILERSGNAVADTVLDQYRTVGAAQISDCMSRLYGIVGLRPLHGGTRRIVGRALTVKARPGDNLMIHKAITLAQAGDVIVVDGGGDCNNALVGELMMMDARRRGVVGFVIDGAVRDADVFAANEFGCFARGVSHKGPYKDGPGEINVAVAVGGQVVHAGDVIVGDADGVVVIPQGFAEAILALALKKEHDEIGSKAKILAGTYEKPWMDRAIAALSGDAK